MPRYQITAPDGGTYEVEGNGTEQEALAHFQRQWTGSPQVPYELKLDNAEGRGDAARYSLSGRGAESGTLEQLAGGIKHAWDRGAMGLKGLFTDLTDEDKALLAQGRSFVKETGPASTVGEIGGDVLMTAAPAARALQGANAVARRLPKALAAATRAAAPAATGAGIGAWTQPEDRATGATAGALGGVVGQGMQRLAGGALKPLVSDDAQALMRRGIQPTPGQAVKGSGVTGNIIASAEEKATSLPVVGDLIQGARRRSLNEFSDAAIQEAGLPATLVKNLPKGNPGAALDMVRENIGDVYKVALTGKTISGSDTMLESVLDVVDDPELFLGREGKAKVLDYMQKKVLDRFDKFGEMAGEQAKQIDSDLGRAAQKFLSSATADDRNMGMALKELQKRWRDNLVEYAGEESGEMLRAANTAYGKLLRAERAAGYLGGEPGVITPAKLLRSTGSMAPKRPTGGRMLPRATESMRNLAETGARVLPSTVPDSGTTGRLLLPGGVAAMYAGVDPFGAATGAALAGGAYSRIGSKLLTQGVAPQTVQRALKALADRGIPEETVLAQWPNFMRSVVQQQATDTTTEGQP